MTRRQEPEYPVEGRSDKRVDGSPNCAAVRGGQAHTLAPGPDPLPRECERARFYLQGHEDLIRLATVLLDQGRDLTALKETIDGLTEAQAKDMLCVSVAQFGRYFHEKHQTAKLN